MAFHAPQKHCLPENILPELFLKLSGTFKGGVTEGGGFHTLVRGTMFVRDGAVTPGPSRECDITFFVKGRPKSARQSRDSTVAARRVQSVTVPSSRVSRECRSPGLRSPPFKNARSLQEGDQGHQNRAPSLLEPRVFTRYLLVFLD